MKLSYSFFGLNFSIFTFSFFSLTSALQVQFIYCEPKTYPENSQLG